MTDHTVPPIGMRMVKTAAAVLICLLVSMAVDREDMRIYSSIAALLCVQPYAEDTKRMAIQRIVGTAIGSVFGIATLLLEMALDIQGTLVGYIVIAAVTVPNLWIAVVLKSPTSTQRFEGAKTLLNYGFAAYGLAEAAPQEPLRPIPVVLGEKAAVTPEICGETGILAPKEKLAAMTVRTELQPQLEAPVEKGQPVGTLTVLSGEETLAELPLVAGEDVPRLTYWKILLRCLQTAFLAG